MQRSNSKKKWLIEENMVKNNNNKKKKKIKDWESLVSLADTGQNGEKYQSYQKCPNDQQN